MFHLRRRNTSPGSAHTQQERSERGPVGGASFGGGAGGGLSVAPAPSPALTGAGQGVNRRTGNAEPPGLWTQGRRSPAVSVRTEQRGGAGGGGHQRSRGQVCQPRLSREALRESAVRPPAARSQLAAETEGTQSHTESAQRRTGGRGSCGFAGKPSVELKLLKEPIS